jgi:hypothetical protein
MLPPSEGQPRHLRSVKCPANPWECSCLPIAMPAIAPALRTGRCIAAAGAALTVATGAVVDVDVGEAVEDEELAPPKGVVSSGNSYSSGQLDSTPPPVTPAILGPVAT